MARPDNPGRSGPTQVAQSAILLLWDLWPSVCLRVNCDHDDDRKAITSRESRYAASRQV